MAINNENNLRSHFMLRDPVSCCVSRPRFVSPIASLRRRVQVRNSSLNARKHGVSSFFLARALVRDARAIAVGTALGRFDGRCDHTLG